MEQYAEYVGAFLYNPHGTVLPLFNSGARCGFPSPAEDYAEDRLSLDDLVGIHAPTCYLLRAKGDSMIGIGIYDGDVLIVDKAAKPLPGHTVVAWIQNGTDSGFLIKTLRVDDEGKPYLQSQNPAYKPIRLLDGETLEIWGVCRWNLHELMRHA
jgi:DNA polymerase V